MVKFILLAVVCGFILGSLLHKWIVKEDLLLAAKVKLLVGQKLAAAKADIGAAKVGVAKVEGEVKADVKVEEKKL